MNCRRTPREKFRMNGTQGFFAAMLGLALAGIFCEPATTRAADSQSLATATPATVGMDEATLRQGVALFRAAVERDDLRGAVLLVARRGHVVLHEPLGWSDYENRRPMARDTLFHVASNTKPVVATVALQLAEQGRLDLDADVGRYLPALANERYQGVTVRRLLSHTSGLRIGPIFLEPLAEKSPALPDGPTLRSEVARFGALGPQVRPGTSYSYNNPGYNIVGAVLETIAERPVDELLSERIYRPLGMHDTWHVDKPEHAPRRARVYTRKGAAWELTFKPGDPPRYPFVRSSGGMVTTALDYAKFLQAMLDRGRSGDERLLSAGAVAAATAPQTRAVASVAERAKLSTYYGYGWQVGVDGSFAHGGSDGTFAWVDPSRELLGVVFTQSPGGKTPTGEFRRFVEQACGEATPVKTRTVAHRGLLREFPENTLVNFRACLERRLGFELDVRRSQDGQLVCLHDDSLDRTTDGTGSVGAKTLAELRRLDAGRWFHAKYQGEKIPTIDEIFELVAQLETAGGVIAIDLKGEDEHLERDVVALARRHGILDRTVMIGRAIEHADVRRRLRAADPLAHVAMLAATPEDLPRVVADADSDWAYVRFLPTAEQVRMLHDAGKRLFVVGPLVAARREDNWRQAIEASADAVLTDFATEFDELLREVRRKHAGPSR